VIFAGGSALAQADLIVDPWARLRPMQAMMPAVQRPAETLDPGSSEPPGLVTSGPPAVRSEPIIEAPGPLGVMLPDPWVVRPVASPASKVTSSVAAPTAELDAGPLHPEQWARVVPEIIDPWGPGRLAAYRDPLIRDPWAH
jgi:hypothetical protein